MQPLFFKITLAVVFSLCFLFVKFVFLPTENKGKYFTLPQMLSFSVVVGLLCANCSSILQGSLKQVLGNNTVWSTTTDIPMYAYAMKTNLISFSAFCRICAFLIFCSLSSIIKNALFVVKRCIGVEAAQSVRPLSSFTHSVKTTGSLYLSNKRLLN